eukprot:gene11523-4687_t
MIENLLILNNVYEILFSNSQGHEIQHLVTIFKEISQESQKPVLFANGISFLYSKKESMFFLITTKLNMNPSLAFEFLDRFESILPDLTPEFIKKNNVLLLEMLHEIICHGIVQITEPDVILELTSNKLIKTSAAKQNKIIEQATGKRPWRDSDVKYWYNFSRVDVCETINCLFNAKGDLLHSEVKGEIKMKSQLSGTPQCKLGYRTKSSIENFHFHQCISTRNLSDNFILFVPPDGEFVLGSYFVSKNVNPPFHFVSTIYDVFVNSRVEIYLAIRATYSENTSFSNILIEIPLPKNSSNCTLNCPNGKAYFDESNPKIIWKIKNFSGGDTISLKAHVDLIAMMKQKPRVQNEPIKLNFTIPYSTSAFKVTYMNVFERSGYKADNWIRYESKSGEYHQRIESK